MPVVITRITPNMLTRINETTCWVCFEKIKVGLDDYVLMKKSRHAKHAHIECGLKKNWVTEDDVNKLYLAPTVFD